MQYLHFGPERGWLCDANSCSFDLAAPFCSTRPLFSLIVMPSDDSQASQKRKGHKKRKKHKESQVIKEKRNVEIEN